MLGMGVPEAAGTLVIPTTPSEIPHDPQSLPHHLMTTASRPPVANPQMKNGKLLVS